MLAYVGNKAVTAAKIGTLAVDMLKLGQQAQFITPLVVPTPISVSDFANNTFSLNGVSHTLVEMWVKDSNWASNWTPATDITAGQGIKISGSTLDHGPLASDAHIAAVNPGIGLTGVMDIEVTGSLTDDAKLEVWTYHKPDYSIEQIFQFRPNHVGSSFPNPSSVMVKSDPSGDTLFNGDGSFGVHRVAFTLSPTQMAFSVDGLPAQHLDGNWPGATAFGIYFEGSDTTGFMRVAKASFYAPVTPDLLTIMSVG